MTSTARERAFGLYKDGYATATKIKKQLEAEGLNVPRPTIENWRRRDKWDATGGVEAIKAVAKQIRTAKDIGKRASQIPAVDEETKASINDAMNELGVVAFEGAQVIKSIMPSVADKISTVAEFNSFLRSIAEVTSLIVTARVELFKVMPDVGPGGGGPGGGSTMISEPSEMEKVYNNAILEFKSRWG